MALRRPSSAVSAAHKSFIIKVFGAEIREGEFERGVSTHMEVAREGETVGNGGWKAEEEASRNLGKK